jgi:hypothetical protein
LQVSIFYIDDVQQAGLGADLDAPQGASGSEVTREIHINCKYADA